MGGMGKPLARFIKEVKMKTKVYQKLIVALMQAKKKRLPANLGRLYFNDRDRTDILGWSDRRAKSVWEQIKLNCSESLDFISFSGLSSETCPFCVVNDCNGCGYRKRHGDCFSDSSDFRQILTALGRKKEGFKDANLLPKSFYIKTIKALEKRYL